MLLAFLVAAQSPLPAPVEAGLKRVLAPVHGAKIHKDESEITVEYHVETVKEPARGKSGGLIKSEPEERPASDGFQIETYEFSHLPSEPPRPEQAVRESSDYLRAYKTWKFDAVERQVKGSNRARYYYLAWGNKVQPKTIAQIRAALEIGTVPIPSKP